MKTVEQLRPPIATLYDWLRCQADDRRAGTSMSYPAEAEDLEEWADALADLADRSGLT
jgi:hypothetical protein